MRTIQFLDFEYFIKTSFSFDKKRYIKNYSLLSKMKSLKSYCCISTQLKDYPRYFILEFVCKIAVAENKLEVGSFL